MICHRVAGLHVLQDEMVASEYDRLFLEETIAVDSYWFVYW